MAAILCQSIGKMASALCTGIDKICAAPFRLCGFTCEALGNLVTSPFFLYFGVTAGFNIPSIIFSFKAYIFDNDDPNECDKLITAWLLVNGFLSIVNIVAAVYITKKIMETNNTAEHPPGNYTATDKDGVLAVSSSTKPEPSSTEGGQASLTRITHVLCHDPVVALYILIGLFYIFWQSNGVSKFANAGRDDDEMALKA
eukprot:CAMPEP_0194365510 /NCGR_PEP_ID=MMETSP0174-20130528/13575_1 /TAXON_ID=216777 /ORGANISM="Proboscia alata, Strain PI-D3" /LENGTH=198 /DNA_ID=CAMNT_0039140245 /DNA_START=22 /DNA_END=622 /DNA_ORIENTATION=-